MPLSRGASNGALLAALRQHWRIACAPGMTCLLTRVGLAQRVHPVSPQRWTVHSLVLDHNRYENQGKRRFIPEREFHFNCVIDMRYSNLQRQLLSHVKRLQQWARCYFCDPFWTISSSQYASKTRPVAGRVLRQTNDDGCIIILSCPLYFHDAIMRQSLQRPLECQLAQTIHSFIVAINLLIINCQIFIFTQNKWQFYINNGTC